MFGDAIDYDKVSIRQRRWWPLQPRNITIAPDGHLWFHPDAPHYHDCFASAPLAAQAHFIHEMTHVWQAQSRGRWYLPLMRHPFCRYRYVIEEGKPLSRYGIEQQAEIIKHAFLARNGHTPALPSLETLAALLPFPGGGTFAPDEPYAHQGDA
jgi:hypothetical protein